MSIMRLWHGEVSRNNGDEYEKFLLDTAVSDYSSVSGLQKIYFQRKNDEDISHFLLVTIWDSLESVKKFAGENPEIAKYYEEDDAYLLKKDTYVSMYDIFYEK